jgi:hypothetical protein
VKSVWEKANKPPPIGGGSLALSGSNVANRGLAAAAIHLRIERYPLAFYEARHASSFQRARMHEYVFATVVWLNEAITFLIGFFLFVKVGAAYSKPSRCAVLRLSSMFGGF